MKLTKKDKRFDGEHLPYEGQEVTLSHATALTQRYYKKTHRDFKHLSLIDGQKGTVVENRKHTTVVDFGHDTLMVSPEFLIVQELTEMGVRAKKLLDKFVLDRR